MLQQSKGLRDALLLIEAKDWLDEEKKPSVRTDIRKIKNDPKTHRHRWGYEYGKATSFVKKLSADQKQKLLSYSEYIRIREGIVCDIITSI